MKTWVFAFSVVCGLATGSCGSEEKKKDPACTSDAGAYNIVVASGPTCARLSGVSTAMCPALFTFTATGQVTAPKGAEFVADTAGEAKFVDLKCGAWDKYICAGKTVAGCCKRKNDTQPQTVTWSYDLGNMNDGYVCGTATTQTFTVKLKLHIPGQCTLAEQTLTFNCV